MKNDLQDFNYLCRYVLNKIYKDMLIVFLYGVSELLVQKLVISLCSGLPSFRYALCVTSSI